MTTLTTTTPAAHTNDSDLNDRANEFFGVHESLLTHVPQTGEVSLPISGAVRTVNTYVGWRIYRFNDALQASAPVFIKVWYGTANSVGLPALKIELGTAVDGAGNFIGVTSQEFVLNNSNGTAPLAGNVVSYASVTAQGFWLSWKSTGLASSGGRSVGAYAIFRSCDSAGNPTGTSVSLFRLTAATNSATAAGYVRSIRFSGPNAVYNCAANYSFAPGDEIASGGLGGDIEAYLGFYRDPKTNPSNFYCCVFSPEFPLGTIFSATLIGSVPRTYISMGLTCGSPVGRGTGTALLWE